MKLAPVLCLALIGCAEAVVEPPDEHFDFIGHITAYHEAGGDEQKPGATVTIALDEFDIPTPETLKELVGVDELVGFHLEILNGD